MFKRCNFQKIFNLVLIFILSFFLFSCKENKPTNPNPTISDNPSETEENIIHTEVLLIDEENHYMELLNCPTTSFDDSIEILLLQNNNIVYGTLNDLLIGMNNVYVQYDKTNIKKILIDNEPVFNTIRVAIRNSIADIANINNLYHDEITILCPFSIEMMTFDGLEKYQIPDHSTLKFEIKDGNIVTWIGNTLIKSDKRLILKGGNHEVQVTSIRRNVGNPFYQGNMEISICNNRLLLINEVDMENYLTKVVPSEMPSSWNMEALKAQAVAARTYAYRDIYDRKFPQYGYAVDDSEQSQVYNNINTAPSSTNAVNNTKGITMFYLDEPIIAYYYSCSCGLTADGNDVWIEDKPIEEIPYLLGHNLTKDSNGNPISFDPTNEERMLNFFKTIKMDSPCGNSSNHRWHVSLTKEQLKNTINANIENMTNTYPTSYPQLENNQWVIKEFPNDIGNIQNIEVDQRSKSGVVISLKITTDKLTFRIINQYNIRFTIRPKDAKSTVITEHAKSSDNTYSSQTTNDNVLGSGFFALEWQNDTLHFYGGGYGHGVGMSQYGANGYASQGLDYKTILEKFYSNIIFKDNSNKYNELTDFEKFFQKK